MAAIMSHFDNEPVEIVRVEQLSSEVFNHKHRNRHPIILSQVISDWLPTTKWTTSYLQKALEHQFQDGLPIFVSHDNRQFINHPDVTKTITCSAEEFLSRVFNCHSACDIQNPPTVSHKDGQTKRQRVYLRTFSMPEILFRDINVPQQIKALLDVVCYIKCEDLFNERQLFSWDISATDNGHCPVHGLESACDQETHQVSAWEEMLTPLCSCVTTCDDESSLAPLSEQNHVPIECSSLQVQDTNQPSRSTCSKERDVLDEFQKSGHHHRNKSVAVECQDMYTRIFNQSTMQLWVGTRGNVTPLHYDRNHGLLAQFVGSKELILFSHEDTRNVYPHLSCPERAHTSRVDLHRLADNVFPKLKRAQPYHCILQPGDLLYMPPFWWHDVTSLDDCISVTLPWDMSSHEDAPVCVYM